MASGEARRSKAAEAAKVLEPDKKLTQEQRLRLFIRVGIQGNAEAHKQIPRIKMTKVNLDRVFEMDVAFLQEESSGAALWPPQWKELCYPPPEMYYVRPKYTPMLDPDALEEEEYRGQTSVFVENAPPECGEAELRAWLVEGISNDDPEVIAAKLEIEDRNAQIKAIEGVLKADASHDVDMADDQTIDGALGQLQGRLGGMQNRLRRFRRDVVQLEKYLDEIYAEKAGAVDELSFSLEKVDTFQVVDTGTWRVRFTDDAKGKRLAYVAVHKLDWAEVKVARPAVPSAGPCVAGMFELPDPGYRVVEVNMRNVRVVRLRDGKGMIKFADDRGYFSGGFEHGARHGPGVELGPRGKFTGSFHQEFRRGPGEQVFANGDVLRASDWRLRPTRGKRSLIRGDEYCDGQAHGNVQVDFADGARFVGEMRDGRVSGEGEYEDSSGIFYKGNFEEGALDGHGSMVAGDMTRVGLWRRGCQHGRGVQIDLVLGKKRGHFRRGLEHGVFKYKCKVVQGRMRAYYWNGMRHGRGVLNYGNIGGEQHSKGRQGEEGQGEREGGSDESGAGEGPVGMHEGGTSAGKGTDDTSKQATPEGPQLPRMALPPIGPPSRADNLPRAGQSARDPTARAKAKARQRYQSRFKFLLPHEKPTGPQLPGQRADGLAMSSVELGQVADTVLGPEEAPGGGRGIGSIVRVPLHEAAMHIDEGAGELGLLEAEEEALALGAPVSGAAMRNRRELERMGIEMESQLSAGARSMELQALDGLEASLDDAGAAAAHRGSGIDAQMSRLANQEALGVLGMGAWEAREFKEKQQKADGVGEYDKFLGADGGKAKGRAARAYQGDIMYEGMFRADRVRAGGVMTLRMGQLAPHMHQRWFAHSSDNSRFLELVDLADREAVLRKGRDRTLRLSHAGALAKRRKQEAENRRSFAYWQDKARRMDRWRRGRNRLRLRGVRDLRTKLAIGEDEYRGDLAVQLGLYDLREGADALREAQERVERERDEAEARRRAEEGGGEEGEKGKQERGKKGGEAAQSNYWGDEAVQDEWTSEMQQGYAREDAL